MTEAATTLQENGSGQERLVVINPATLEEAGSVVVSTADQMRETVARAREVQKSWAALGFSQRGRMLKRVRDAIIDGKEEIAEVISSETGKPLAESYMEMMYVCDGIGFWTKNAPRFLADRQLRPHLLKSKKAYTTYKPRGVIGMITPWNYPLVLSVGEAIPALAAGNAVVIKPSSTTPLSTVIPCRIAEEAGLPAGLLTAIAGPGQLGWELIDEVDMVSFTGSVETGRKIQIKCAEQLKPTTMELGGKDPMIVCEDANLERAANGCVWGSLTNTGQVCMSVERVYVHEKVYDQFVEKVVEKVGRLSQGPPSEYADLGSMTQASQLETVTGQVESAREAGARVLAGGKRGSNSKGYWYEPTILVDVNHGMEIMHEETFGPVIAIQKVANDTEALELANDSRFGLSASVWSRDKAGAMNMGRKIEAGAVCVNDHMIHMMIPEISMGGVKESGIGHRHGPGGIRKYCHEQSIVVDRFGMSKEPLWYPAPKGLAGFYSKALNLLFRSGWKNKLLG